MTREQKAIAAYGSVVVVGLFLILAWSRPLGLVLMLLGLAAVTAVLRLTHPMGSMLRDRLGLPSRATTSTVSQDEQRRMRAELQRRRDEATSRTLGRDDPRL